MHFRGICAPCTFLTRKQKKLDLGEIYFVFQGCARYATEVACKSQNNKFLKSAARFVKKKHISAAIKSQPPNLDGGWWPEGGLAW